MAQIPTVVPIGLQTKGGDQYIRSYRAYSMARRLGILVTCGHKFVSEDKKILGEDKCMLAWFASIGIPLDANQTDPHETRERSKDPHEKIDGQPQSYRIHTNGRAPFSPFLPCFSYRTTLLPRSFSFSRPRPILFSAVASLLNPSVSSKPMDSVIARYGNSASARAAVISRSATSTDSIRAT